MMVEKVPDSTYEMTGGLDKQIKEIKEVIELPVKHPELFDALGIAQPKVCIGTCVYFNLRQNLTWAFLSTNCELLMQFLNLLVDEDDLKWVTNRR